MKINYEFVKRKIMNEEYLVPIGEAAFKFNGMFALTDVAGFIWDLIPIAENEKAIVEKICQKYDVTEDVAKEDVAEFFQTLRQMGIVD